jgi:hypothetical protein
MSAVMLLGLVNVHDEKTMLFRQRVELPSSQPVFVHWNCPRLPDRFHSPLRALPPGHEIPLNEIETVMDVPAPVAGHPHDEDEDDETIEEDEELWEDELPLLPEDELWDDELPPLPPDDDDEEPLLPPDDEDEEPPLPPDDDDELPPLPPDDEDEEPLLPPDDDEELTPHAAWHSSRVSYCAPDETDTREQLGVEELEELSVVELEELDGPVEMPLVPPPPGPVPNPSNIPNTSPPVHWHE